MNKEWGKGSSISHQTGGVQQASEVDPRDGPTTHTQYNTEGLYMHDLKDSDVHYENYRAQCIQEMTRHVKTKLSQDNRMESPIPILPLSTPDVETEKLIKRKDEELKRMQEMLNKMQQQMHDKDQ